MMAKEAEITSRTTHASILVVLPKLDCWASITAYWISLLVPNYDSDSVRSGTTGTWHETHLPMPECRDRSHEAFERA